MDVKLSRLLLLLFGVLTLLSSALLFSGCVGAMKAFDQGMGPLELGEIAAGGEGDHTGAPQREHAYLATTAAQQQLALDLSQAASTSATIPEVKSLASQIAAEQTANATHMQAINNRLFGKDVVADGSAAATFSLTADQAGLTVDPAMLTGADPYDQQYIDLTVPVLQGSVRLAQAFLSNSVRQDLELRFLAQTVLAQESSEIVSLNDLRTANYGAPSPAGGVPVP